MKNIIAILVLSLVGLNLTAQEMKKAAKENTTQGYKVGDKAADFNLKNIDGMMLSLSYLKDVKGYIVVFTSNNCPYAVGYEDRIIELNNNMAPKGYPVIALNSNDAELENGESFADMVQRHKEKQFTFPYLIDDKAVFLKYGANKTPHVFLLDKDLIVRYIGAIDDSANDPEKEDQQFVVNAIAALEKGSAPDPATTKAIGCPIKSSKASTARGGKRGGPPSPEAILVRMDTNQDNKISKEEAHGPLAKDFDNLDKDKDGFLSKEELPDRQRRGRK